ncbi:MAG: diguanylate cyclase [Candidatus Sedimenticola sp. (ex Thyasira tokunagai)]
MYLIRNHIGGKILAVVGITALISLLGMVLFYTISQQRTILENNANARMELLESVGRGLHSIMLTGSAEIARNYAEELMRIPGIAEFRFLRIDGLEAFHDNETIYKVNWHKGKELFAPREEESDRRVIKEDLPMLHQAISEQRIVQYNEEAPDGTPLLTFLSPIRNHKDCLRCHDDEGPVLGVIKLTSSLKPVYDAIAETRLHALVVMGIFMLLLGVLTFGMLRRTIVQPIKLVTEAMNQVEEGDFTQEVPIPSQDELGRMARSFNGMTVQLLQTYTGLQREQDKLTTIILSASEGIVVTDNEGHVVLVNPAAELLLGKTMGQIVQQGFMQLLDQPPLLQRLLDGEVEDCETVEFNQRLLQVFAAHIRRNDGESIGSAALVHDVTEQKRLESQLRQLSYTDQLTGLYNRRSLEETLEKQLRLAQRHNQPLSLIMFDVDHFKHFNDTHGHDQGDRVLTALGEMCWELCRHTDHPCRYGGEEFCIILPHTEAEGAMVVAEKLRQKVEQTPVDNLQVTISLGVACTANHTDIETGNDLIKLADQALYKSKEGGRNRTELFCSG